MTSPATQLCALLLLVLFSSLALAKDLGNGFRDHGVAVPISNHRGLVATVDGAGRKVVLLWLMDHRGGYALLLIDAETGKSETFPLPFFKDGIEFDAPYASILSSGNKFYTHFNSHFVEFDPAKRAYTACEKTAPQMAMSMTEDDKGVIWSATYPQSGVVSFDPATKKLRDYGQVYKQNWSQYPRYIAADDSGWIYFSLGETASQIISLDPASGKATPVLAEGERKKGIAYLYRDLDGRVYGCPQVQPKENWRELYKGQIRRLDRHDAPKPKKFVTGSQGLYHGVFPDGSTIQDCSLANRRLIIKDAATGKSIERKFDYASDGAIVMGLVAAPDGTITGGTAFPMNCFRYDPRTERIDNRPAYGQWNTITRRDDHIFVGAYPGGYVLDWEPARPWVATVKGKAESNPRYLRDCDPQIHRPACMVAHSDGRTMIMGGTPQYGYTGGGLLLWNTQTNEQTLLSDSDIIPDQSTCSLIPLSATKILGATTTSPGTGGEKKARQAELYIMDLATKRLDWHAPVIPGVQEYTQLFTAADGTVYGIADRKIFFTVDPSSRTVSYQKNVEAELGLSASQQGPRIFIAGPDGATYVLFLKGIVRVEPTTLQLTLVAKSPIQIDSGGDHHDGRIYFISGSHIASWQIR